MSYKLFLLKFHSNETIIWQRLGNRVVAGWFLTREKIFSLIFVPDGVNSVGDYNSTRVGVVCKAMHSA